MIQFKMYNLLPEFGTNTYLIWDDVSNHAILVDVAAPSESVVNDIHDMKLKLRYVINTHGHADHIGGNHFIKEHFSPLICIHNDDKDKLTDPQKNLSAYMGNDLITPIADKCLEDNEVLNLGMINFTVLHTPGHTPGGICLLFDDFVITGDTLFYDSIGRTDLPGGNFQQIQESIQKKLFTLKDSLIVLPGHGESSTIENEKVGNPYVGLTAKL
jgi:glyoxylase-like metal-dependent hydrolase (beta-lactamase superfamily II)